MDLVVRVFSERLGRPVSRADLGWRRDAEPTADGAETAAARLWRVDATAGDELLAVRFTREALDRPVMDWIIGSGTVPIPAQRFGPVVTGHDVQVATDMLAMFRKLDHAYGAGQLRHQVVNYLTSEMSRLIARPPADPDIEKEGGIKRSWRQRVLQQIVENLDRLPPA